MAASLLVGTAVPATAQYYPYPPAYPPAPPPPAYGLVQPHEADGIVRSLGLTPIAPPRPHGPVIIVHALGREGSEVQVTLDRRSGRVRQIIRVGYGAPRIATVPPGIGPYDGPPDAPGFFDDEEEDQPETGNGPRVITREGIEQRELPAPGVGPRVVGRNSDITGSTPRAAPGPADPLLGVPKEFRNRAADRDAPSTQRLAARTPADSVPRLAPLPRPRPADAPSLARREPAAPDATANKPVPEPKARPAPAAEDYPVQPLE